MFLPQKQATSPSGNKEKDVEVIFLCISLLGIPCVPLYRHMKRRAHSPHWPHHERICWERSEVDGVKLQNEVNGFIKVEEFTSGESWRAEKGPRLEAISLHYVCP